MQSPSIARQLTATIVTPVALLLLTAFLLTLQILRLSNSALLVEHSDAVIAKSTETYREIIDQETGLRGFMLTGAAEFLQPFENAQPKVRIAELHMLTRDNPVQADAVRQLEYRYDLWFAGAEMRREQTQAKQVVPLAELQNGKRLMDEVRRKVTAVYDGELDLRNQRQTELRSASSLTLAGVFPMLLILAGILAFASRRQLQGINDTFVSALAKEQDAREAIEVHAWARSEHAKLSVALLGDLTVHEICTRAIRQIAEATGAQIGAYYLLSDDQLELRGHYALADSAPKKFQRDDGLLGAALAKNELVHVRNVPGGYLRVASGTGQHRTEELLIQPTYAEGMPRGVLELGFFGHVNSRSMDLLPRVGETIAFALRAAQQKNHLRELLAETQCQADILQSQQEELAASNEELQQQTEALREAHEQLNERKDELEASNLGLEGQKNELLRLSSEIERKAAEIERASQYKSEFVANMSHELRTPLNSSLILSKMLADNEGRNLTTEQVKYAETIHSAGNDLLALINDILDLSKIEAGKAEVHLELLSLSELVEGVVRMFEPVAKERGVLFDVQGDTHGTFESDGQRVEQILRNLLSNAFKFTERGQVQLRVKFGGDLVRFTVVDSGIGIAKEHVDSIFEAFRQADGTTNRRFGGTGLGLSIARDLARLLGGDVFVESTVGSGSSFTLTLPRVPTMVKARQTPTPQQVKKAPMRRNTPQPFRSPRLPVVVDDREVLDGKSPILLIVEDDASFAELVKEVGREIGFQCLVATTAEEALALAHEHPPSSVILDMKLPDHPGLLVLDRLKANAVTRNVPVHIISANDHIKAAKVLGASGYAVKPIKRDELVTALNQMRDRVKSLRRILIVEDDAVQRDATVRLLSNELAEVIAVESASAALIKLRSAAFDCVVMDLKLGDVSGFELLEQMAVEEGFPMPPVIVYTARQLTQDEEARLLRNSRSIIVKGPRSSERLVDEVSLFLHQVVATLPPGQKRNVAHAKNRDTAIDGRIILLAEDDVRNVFALTSFLEGRGAKVVSVRNGRQAIDRLELRDDIDLVLMDLMMPEMDGIAAMTHIRALGGRFAKIPMIAITAKAMIDDQQRCIEAGANDYIAKPLNVEMLLSLIRVWLS